MEEKRDGNSLLWNLYHTLLLALDSFRGYLENPDEEVSWSSPGVALYWPIYPPEGISGGWEVLDASEICPDDLLPVILRSFDEAIFMGVADLMSAGQRMVLDGPTAKILKPGSEELRGIAQEAPDFLRDIILGDEGYSEIPPCQDHPPYELSLSIRTSSGEDLRLVFTFWPITIDLDSRTIYQSIGVAFEGVDLTEWSDSQRAELIESAISHLEDKQEEAFGRPLKLEVIGEPRRVPRAVIAPWRKELDGRYAEWWEVLDGLRHDLCIALLAKHTNPDLIGREQLVAVSDLLHELFPGRSHNKEDRITLLRNLLVLDQARLIATGRKISPSGTYDTRVSFRRLFQNLSFYYRGDDMPYSPYEGDVRIPPLEVAGQRFQQGYLRADQTLIKIGWSWTDFIRDLYLGSEIRKGGRLLKRGPIAPHILLQADKYLSKRAEPEIRVSPYARRLMALITSDRDGGSGGVVRKSLDLVISRLAPDETRRYRILNHIADAVDTLIRHGILLPGSSTRPVNGYYKWRYAPAFHNPDTTDSLIPPPIYPEDLKEARRRAGLRQIDLSERWGYSRSFWSLVENGKRPIPHELERTVRRFVNEHYPEEERCYDL